MLVTLREKNWIISVTAKSEISNVCNAVEGHCFQAMKIVRHHARALILREKQFQYCLANTKDLRFCPSCVRRMEPTFQKIFSIVICIRESGRQ